MCERNLGEPCARGQARPAAGTELTNANDAQPGRAAWTPPPRGVVGTAPPRPSDRATGARAVRFVISFCWASELRDRKGGARAGQDRSRPQGACAAARHVEAGPRQARGWHVCVPRYVFRSQAIEAV
jgi:hypothetical protein